MYLEGTLVEDRKKDTLLYAGAVKVSITDWFFLQDQAELEYIGLENAIINLYRTDSVWNHQFIFDYFDAPPSTKPKKRIELLLKRADLQNVVFRKTDEWIGQNMAIGIGNLKLDAEEINFSRKKIFANSLVIDKPFFSILNYQGKKVKSKPVQDTLTNTGNESAWNPENWDILVKEISLRDGKFKNDKFTERNPFPYFDGNHIEFSSIQGTFKNVSWQKDTITTEMHLSAKERSGFSVKSIDAIFILHPKAMVFDELDIQTPKSRIRKYYSMRYNDFNRDMGNFLHKVKLEGRFVNSTISSDDLAYFAPELKKWHKTIRIDGNVAGTIDNISARNVSFEAGKDTRLNGDIRLAGLPDMSKTYIDFKSNDFRTTYTDAINFIPELKNISEPRLSEIGFIRFKGTYTGYLRDFVTFGTIETGLGTIIADVNMKFPRVGQPNYSGKLITGNFDLGKFIGAKSMGRISFDGTIQGKGFKANTGMISVNGGLKTFEFNNYTYSNITLNGDLNNQLFSGKASIDDPNLKLNLDGSFNLDSEHPEFNMLAVVQRSNLKALNFSKDDIHVLGKFKMNFTGKTIDDFIGEASLFDVAVTKNDETYVFDSLELNSVVVDNRKQITVSNSDVKASISGEFTLKDLPNTITYFLNKYYPTYFKVPSRAVKNQDFVLEAKVNNIDQYLQLFDKDVKGFDNSSINAKINTQNKSLTMDIDVPYASYKKYEFSDFRLSSTDNNDSLKVFAQAGRIAINDSLQFPTTAINITTANDVSRINILTGATQTINAANLSANVTALKDGLRIHFNSSTIVLNDKTWRIEDDGELTISRTLLNASEIKLTNGEQEILISSLPSDISNSNDVIVSLRKVNLSDFLPYIMKEPRIQGITNAEVTIEDPFNKLRVFVNAQTDQTRFENDSIGITSLNGYWDNGIKKTSFHLISENRNYEFKINGSLDLKDSVNRQIDATIEVNNTVLTILERYIGTIFGELKGNATGKLRIVGDLKEPDVIGSVKLKDGGMKVLYTQCFYDLAETTVEFKPDEIDFGEILVTDKFKNRATLSGKLKHHFFRDFTFDIRATSPRLLLVNTNKTDNAVFYGSAIGRALFRFSGPEENMSMYVNAEPVDSSTMSILTSGTSKNKGEVDYIVWKQYGREMNEIQLKDKSNNLSIDLDLAANPLLKMNVILDELTGDIISANGVGNIKLHTGTSDRMTLNGRYNIASGKYQFNFQNIFNKPFLLEPGSGSYISWTGDPYDAEININATYVAEKVRMSTLFDSQSSSGTVTDVNSDVLKEMSDVRVLCNLTGTLSAPNPTFQIEIPPNSPVKNNPAVDTKLKTINRDANEVNKQATYLIVFRSFAPPAAIVSSDINQELINTTISGVINSILSNSIQNLFYKLLGSSVDVNFNYSRIITDPSGVTTGSSGTSSSANTRENVSLQFMKSVLNNKLVITFGSDFNFAATGASSATNPQGFLFLPDVNVEYKITPDGKLRTSFFYRSNFDVLSTSGKQDRTGGNISYRTEFDYLFSRKKKSTAKSDTTDSGSNMKQKGSN
jgi:TamB, inner membrane protein subunit of TAM complex